MVITNIGEEGKQIVAQFRVFTFVDTTAWPFGFGTQFHI